MSCYHKKLMILSQEGEKLRPLFLNHDQDWQNLDYHDIAKVYNYSGAMSMVDFQLPKDKEKRKVYQIPCGSCIGCRLDYSRTWADRIVMESMMSKPGQSWFLTLTYSDDLLPDREGNPALVPVAVDSISGAVSYEQRAPWSAPSLYPKHLQDFMKRLRKRFGDGIRFFAAGEYGDQYGRPHYHLCVMNLDIHDQVFYKYNDFGDPLFTSKEIEECWSMGFCPFGRLNWQTAAYTARYVIKKQKGQNASIYAEKGIQPEFCRMSRRPGLGSTFFEKAFPALYPVSESGDPVGSRLVLPAMDRSRPYRVDSVRYFDKILEKCDPDLLAKYRSYREKLGASSHKEQRACDAGFESRYFALKESEKLKSANTLLRNL